ncbi:MAG: hypothetical protein EB003_12055, partial [Flavobacteriia bacterium]|nr:hypothetical protein [Flavobacteriia bacterium]
PVEEVTPEEEERLSDAAILKLLRQKVKVAPRVLSLDPSDRSESDLTERLQQRLRQNSMLSSLFNRLDQLDQIEKELIEKLRSADRQRTVPLQKFATPIETRTAAGELQSRATIAQRIGDWVQDVARGSDTTQSRKALEDTLNLMDSAERAVARPEEDLFFGTETARAVESRTPAAFQQFMASDVLQKIRTAEGTKLLAEAQKSGPPTPAAVQRVKQLLKPTTAFLNKQIDSLTTLVKKLTDKMEAYRPLAQAQVEVTREFPKFVAAHRNRLVGKAKLEQAEVISELAKDLARQHNNYARAKLELENAQQTWAGLKTFLDANIEAMENLFQLEESEAAFFKPVRAEIKTKQETLRTALGRLGILRGEINNKFGDILSMEAPGLEAGAIFDPEFVSDYVAAQQKAKAAFEDFYRSTAAFGEMKKRAPQYDVSALGRDINNFLKQDAELTELIFEQEKVVKNWERQVKSASTILTKAQKAAQQDPVWSAFLKEAQEAVDNAIASVNKLEAPLSEMGRTPNKMLAAARGFEYLRTLAVSANQK